MSSNSLPYMPTEEALKFISFIRAAGVEDNNSPEIHYKLADKYFGNHKQVVIESFRGSAKALALNELVYLEEGGTKTIEEVQVGDHIYGYDGKPTKVLAKSEVFKDKNTYTVELSDGRVVTCSDDHLWSVKQKGSVGGLCKEFKTLTTEEMFNTQYYYQLEDERNPSGKESKYYLPLANPVEYAEKALPIDPYTIGVLIGDGSISKDTGYARITVHNDDAEELFGYIPYKKGVNSTPNRSSVFRGLLGLGKRLKALGLNVNTYNKRIPEIYKRGSVRQRIELLQGLMDTDGTAGKYHSSFCTVNTKLVEDVYSICTGLGLRVVMSTEVNGSIGYHRLHITHRGFNPFKLKRKADKVAFKARNGYQKIKEIRRAEPTPSQCLVVDNDSKLFLTTNHVVTHNSTLMEWYVIYAAVNGRIANFGVVNFIAFVGDSAENGVKNFFRNIQTKIDRSEFLQQFLTIKRCTNEEAELVNVNGHQLNIKGYGMKALALDSKLLTADGYTTIGSCRVGDKIYGADGKLCTILHKSEVFNKPMYRLTLADGRSIKVSGDHINSVVQKTDVNNKAIYSNRNMTTTELLECSLVHSRTRKRKNKPDYTSNEDLIFIENCKALEYKEKNLPVDPYTLGCLLGDGAMSGNQTVRLSGLLQDLKVLEENIPYRFGKWALDKRTEEVYSVGVNGLQQKVKQLGVNVHGSVKGIPHSYLLGSVSQRLDLLQGLMDTDGTIDKHGRTKFYSQSDKLTTDIIALVRSLGGTAHKRKQSRRDCYEVEMWLNRQMFKLPRKQSRQKYTKDTKVAIRSITPIEAEKSQCIAVDNKEHQFITGDYVRTHNTNIRGVRYNGQRPEIVIMDDVTTNEALTSETIRKTISDNFYKAIMPALHPTHYRLFVIGTPISENDILSKLRTNKKWVVHQFPVAEEFPCTREEFKGNWEDRFDYDAVLDKYETFKEDGELQSFYQEYMLEITDLSTLLVEEGDIQWFDPSQLVKHKASYNFYIVTDFATSTKKSADFSTIGVVAVSSNNDWLLVDGQCIRQTMQDNMDDLFRYVKKWAPLSVGIESSGQQGGFISILQEMMVSRNIWFTFAKKPGSKDPGIRPVKDKMHRFVTGVQPKFKQNKVWLPKPELAAKVSPRLFGLVEELLRELSRLTLAGGTKALAHDDAIDLLNQLSEMDLYAPTGSEELTSSIITDDGLVWTSVWGDDEESDGYTNSVIF